MHGPKWDDLLLEFYDGVPGKWIRTDSTTAETIKYVANAYLASKISFFNESWRVCNHLGVDPDLVAEAVALDPRIGAYGVHGGHPFGGACLPNDLEAFVTFLTNVNELQCRLLKAVQEANRRKER